MEVYKDLSLDTVKEFENLLNSQMSKVKIEEGKIINGTVTKISEKFVFLFVEGLKSEPVLDINEIKSLNLFDKLKVGSKLPVLLEKIEDKNGEVIVSASKAQKIKGWDMLVKAYDNNEPIIGKITSKIQRPDSILIDGRINGDTYVVLGNSGLDRNFRSSMETAPLNNQFNLFLYDHMSTVVGKYLKDRPTNKPGDTRDMLPDIKFLQDIKLPVVSEGGS